MRAFLAIVLVAGAAIAVYLLMGGGDAEDRNGGDAPGPGPAAEAPLDAEALKRLNPLLSVTATRPLLEHVNRVKDSDLPGLIALAKKEPSLKHKRPLVWTLGIKGGEPGAEALKDVVEHDYGAAELSIADEDVIFESLQALGLAAARDKKAYEFALKGTDPEFWRGRRTWTSGRGDHATHMLVSYSVQALGLSGRPESKEHVEALKNKDAHYLHAWAGDVTQAVFYRWVRAVKGEQALHDYLLRRDDHRTFWFDWQRTAEGQQWYRWASEMTSGPVPPKPD